MPITYVKLWLLYITSTDRYTYLQEIQSFINYYNYLKLCLGRTEAKGVLLKFPHVSKLLQTTKKIVSSHRYQYNSYCNSLSSSTIFLVWKKSVTTNVWLEHSRLVTSRINSRMKILNSTLRKNINPLECLATATKGTRQQLQFNQTEIHTLLSSFCQNQKD